MEANIYTVEIGHLKNPSVIFLNLKHASPVVFLNLNLWFLTEEHTCLNTNAVKIKELGKNPKPHLKSTWYNCIIAKGITSLGTGFNV